MRPKVLIFFIVIVLAILAVLFWRRPVQPSSDSKQLQQQINPQKASAASASNVQPETSNIAPATISFGTNITIIEYP